MSTPADDAAMLIAIDQARNAWLVGEVPVGAVIMRDGKVIALGQPAPKPQLRIYGLDYEFANVDELPVSSMYPWKGVIAPDIMPAEPTTLELWALDVAGMRVTRIDVLLKVDKSANTAERMAP